MRFAHAELLWLLLLLPLLAFFAAARLRRGRRALAELLGETMAQRLTRHLAPGRTGWQLTLLLLALAVLILGAARPQRGTQYVTARRTGSDLIVALDVSASMLAEDLAPSRLARARHEIAGLLDRLGGDRVGLVAFAGAAFVQCPLTLDYGAARMFLEYMSPDLIPEPGTSLAAALRVATGAFEQDQEGARTILLITDGEDHEGDVAGATREARAAGVRVFAVGIGSAAGEPIPERDAEGAIDGYKQDREGRVVMTRLDEAVLRRIAEETGGLYVAAGSTLGLDRVMDAIEELEQRELEGGVRMLYEERYRYFVWPAWLFLMAALWVPDRRRPGLAPLDSAVVRGLPVVLALLVSAGWSAAGQALPGSARPAPPSAAAPAAPGLSRGAPGRAPGDSLAPAGELDPAQWRELYEENEVFRTRHPEDPRPLYNLGNLHHLRGDYEVAAEHYAAAAARATGAAAAQILYNLGNTQARAGRLTEAREAYVGALRRDPHHRAAKENLELVQRLLDQRTLQPDSTATGGEGSEGAPGEADSSATRGESSPERDAAKENGEEPGGTQEPREGEGSPEQQQGEQSGQQSGERPGEGRGEQPDLEPERQPGEQPEEQAGAQPEEQPEQQAGEEGSPAGADSSAAPAAADSLAARAAEGDAGVADSTQALDALQLRQLLRGLEHQERELLRRRFQARAHRVDVEKDW